MQERIESEYAQQRKALEFLSINIEDWDSQTPENRRKNYHKIIMKAILKNHPDKHPGLAEDSPEFIKWNDNTKLLNSISYDYGTAAPDHLPRAAHAVTGVNYNYSSTTTIFTHYWVDQIT